MRRLWPYITLIHPYAVGLVLLATAAFGLLAAEGRPAPGPFLRLLGVVLLSQICVGITNDLHDLPLDRLSKPYKPLVAGRAQVGLAHRIAWAAGIGALLLGLTFGPLGLLYAALGTATGLVYNFWLKGTLLSWLPYALGFSLLPLWPFIALQRWTAALADVWLLAVPASLALNLAQSLADIESDRSQGVYGIAQHLGPRRALVATGLACGLTVVLALLTALRRVSVPQQVVPLLFAALVSSVLISLAIKHTYRHPDVAARLRTWRLIAAGITILAIGWLWIMF